MTRIIALALSAFLLAGCAGADKSVLQGGSNIFTQVKNPLTTADQAKLEAAYIALATPAAAFMELPTCRKGTEPSVTNICGPYAAKVKVQSANRKAYAALVTLRNFKARNPTLSGVSLLDAARKAMMDFQTTAYLNKVGE
jgi:hypothetical protein